MVYARIGRTGIYQLQDLVRLVNDQIFNRDIELQNVYHLIRAMGSGMFTEASLVRRMDFDIGRDSIFYNRILNPPRRILATKESKDSKDLIDSEAYDRFCNKQDRAYSASELFELLDSVGLNFVNFNRPSDRIKFDL